MFGGALWPERNNPKVVKWSSFGMSVITLNLVIWLIVLGSVITLSHQNSDLRQVDLHTCWVQVESCTGEVRVYVLDRCAQGALLGHWPPCWANAVKKMVLGQLRPLSESRSQQNSLRVKLRKTAAHCPGALPQWQETTVGYFPGLLPLDLSMERPAWWLLSYFWRAGAGHCICSSTKFHHKT